MRHIRPIKAAIPCVRLLNQLIILEEKMCGHSTRFGPKIFHWRGEEGGTDPEAVYTLCLVLKLVLFLSITVA